MSEKKESKFRNWLSENRYKLFADVFIWVIPLILLIILACESKTEKVSIKLWGGVVGAIIVVIYFVGLRKWISKKIEFEKHEQLRVPIWLRLLQGCITLICIGVALIFVYAVQDMFNEIKTYLICVMVSVAIGYIFLILDSKSRKPKKIIRQE